MKILTLEYMNIPNLPKDLIKLLILEHFDGLDALTALRVCKRWRSYITTKDLDKIHTKILKEQCWNLYGQNYINTFNTYGNYLECGNCTTIINRKNKRKHITKCNKLLELRPKEACKISDVYHLKYQCLLLKDNLKFIKQIRYEQRIENETATNQIQYFGIFISLCSFIFLITIFS